MTNCLTRLGPACTGARLLCLPHAGASADAYVPWIRDLAGVLELWAVTPAGRRHRAAEPLRFDPDLLIAEVAEEVSELDDRPLLIFGHSMGALIGYEVAAVLAGTPHQPRAVVVSGTAAPHLRDARRREYTDQDLAESLIDWGGTAPEVAADPQLQQLLFPPLRADLQLCDAYRRTAPHQLPSPLSAVAGRDDRVAPPAQVAAWAEYTTEFLGLTRFPGGHFFVTACRKKVVDHVVWLAMQVLTRR